MPPLKLFVSHSSRLDDVDHKYSDDDHNWKLLGETCKAIREYYGDRVDVLVDNDGLIPGDDWNHQLNLWLAECHVAIVLFSKRAIDKSNWVAKEAAILSWRAELDDKFKLIPVLLNGESTPEDLAKDFLGTLKIDRSQCIRNAAKPADILAGLRKALGEPEDLAAEHPQTPLEKLQGGVAKLLSEQATTVSLKEALAILGCKLPPQGLLDRQHCADLLARKFLSSRTDQADSGLDDFLNGIGKLTPRPPKDSAEYIFQLIRSLWVEPCAAAQIPLVLQRNERKPIVLAGMLVTQSDTFLRVTVGYTLERYLERMMVDSAWYCCVTLTSLGSLDDARKAIREKYLGPDLPKQIPLNVWDNKINDSKKSRVILLVLNVAKEHWPPNAEQLLTLGQLQLDYKKLITILATTDRPQPLPESVYEVIPPLSPELECAAYASERAAKAELLQIYGTD